MDELPQDATHFFTNIDFAFVSEINYEKLEELSQLVLENTNSEKYLDLRESLIKLLWAKLSGIRAISFEYELVKQYEPGVLIQEYIVQMEHEKSIFEFITHTKSCLDALATFLNVYFDLNQRGGNIDFKKRNFREKLIEKETSFRNILGKLNIWLQEKRGKADSIISIRDFWIHQSTPWIQLYWPPTSLGVLPIPKNLEKPAFAATDLWKTEDFFKYHYDLLSELFMSIVEICIKLERMKQPDLNIRRSVGKVCFFPFMSTESREFTVRLGKITEQYLNITDINS